MKNNLELDPLEQTKNSKASQAFSWVKSPHASEQDLLWLEDLEKTLGLSLQQLRQVFEWKLDAQIWKERHFFADLNKLREDILEEKHLTPSQKRDHFFSGARNLHQTLAARLKEYPEQPAHERHPTFRFLDKELKGEIKKLCPAASHKGVCCGLQTLNIVENCAMGCSYCVLQNQYEEPLIKVPVNLAEKLSALSIDPSRRQRVCTGEYSDSLLWGNKNNILTDLCQFARNNTNMVLELKTKSIQIEDLLKLDVPRNLVVSWSINSPLIIEHEERRTPSLRDRLAAAQEVAKRGIGIAFHLHPMIYYKGWENDYTSLIEELISGFDPQSVLWVSLGTITYPRGLESELRRQYTSSKIWQMDTEETPDGKITYAYSVRQQLYAEALKALSPWKGKVYTYMCMEFQDMWEELYGFAYHDMESFNQDMNKHVWDKLGL